MNKHLPIFCLGLGAMMASPVHALECANDALGAAPAAPASDTGDGDATACGRSATASGNDSVAVGRSAVSGGDFSAAVGYGPSSGGHYALAIGVGALAGGESAISIGNGPSASMNSGIAIGLGTSASGESGTALGSSASAGGDFATALGSGASASSVSSTAVGNGATTGGDTSTAVGYTATASEHRSTALGYEASATGISSVAVGRSASATMRDGTAVGVFTSTTGEKAAAMGYQASASGDSSIALGRSAQSSGAISASLGVSSRSIGSGALALGYGARADATSSTALGYLAQAVQANSIILGSIPSVNTGTNYANIGIGTNTPSQAVDVQRSGVAARFQLTSFTDTATNAPQYIQRRARGTSFVPAAVLNNDNLGLFSFRGYNGTAMGGSRATITAQAAGNFTDSSTPTRLIFATTPAGQITPQQVLVITPDGQVQVNGQNLNVPDYVFEEDYELMPLTELKKFIEANGHLPGVASAEEVRSGSHDLAGSDMVQLRKIEELTLYTLQQEAALQELRQEVAALRAQLAGN